MGGTSILNEGYEVTRRKNLGKQFSPGNFVSWVIIAFSASATVP